MGPQLPPPNYRREVIVKTTIIVDLVWAGIAAGLSFFDRGDAGAMCVILGVIRIVQSINTDAVRWDAGSDEMLRGRVGVIGLAFLWICAGIILIATR
jgi:hypothetical protein